MIVPLPAAPLPVRSLPIDPASFTGFDANEFRQFVLRAAGEEFTQNATPTPTPTPTE